jgi:tetratricopeptide (TPR) repeat protein/TolB-like protein
MRRLLLATLGLTVGAWRLAAQCPDGSVCAANRPAVHKAPPTAQVRARQFMLLPFRNVTRTPAADWLVTGAPLMLGEALGQFTDLTVVPDQRMTAAMRRLGLALDVAPDATQLASLAEATGAWTAVNGKIIASGSKLQISADALDIPTGRVIARATTTADTSIDIRQAFDRVTVQLLGAVGVRGTSDLAALTTRSVDAYRAYADGVALVRQSAFRRGATALKEAVRLDSSFAMAWSALSFASLQAGGLPEILNPMSGASHAAEQAVRQSARLPARQAALNHVLLEAFRAEFARAHRLADSLVASDPGDPEALSWLGLIELLDTRLDTTGAVPGRAGSLNRAIEMTKAALDRDPTRFELYAFPAMIYSFTGGLVTDFVGARRHPMTSLAAEFLVPFEVYFQPVLRDTIVYIVDTTFARWPEAARDSAKLRGANAGVDWVARWLVASPNDPEAHLWLSRFHEMRGEYDAALGDLDRTMALGPESNLENLRARRLALLELSRRYNAAESLADSIVQSGGVRSAPWHAALDRSRLASVLTYVRLKRWSKLAAVVNAFAPPPDGGPKCMALAKTLRNRQFAVVKSELQALADTVTAHIDEVRAVPELAPCADMLSKVARPLNP